MCRGCFVIGRLLNCLAGRTRCRPSFLFFNFLPFFLSFFSRVFPFLPPFLSCLSLSLPFSHNGRERATPCNGISLIETRGERRLSIGKMKATPGNHATAVATILIPEGVIRCRSTRLIEMKSHRFQWDLHLASLERPLLTTV